MFDLSVPDRRITLASYPPVRELTVALDAAHAELLAPLFASGTTDEQIVLEALCRLQLSRLPGGNEIHGEFDSATGELVLKSQEPSVIDWIRCAYGDIQAVNVLTAPQRTTPAFMSLLLSTRFPQHRFHITFKEDSI